MNEYCTIKMQSRRNPEISTESFQISASTRIHTLSAYLNKIYNKDSKHTFLYGNAVVSSLAVSELIERHKLGYENTITLEYLDLDEDTPDPVMESPCPIVKCASCRDKLYFLEYDGSISTRHHNETIESPESLRLSSADLKYEDIAAERSIYGIADASVYNLEDNQVVKTFNEKLKSISTHSDRYAVTTENGNLYLVDGKEEEVLMSKSARNLKISEQALYWLESLNVIRVYTFRNKKIKEYASRHVMTDIIMDSDTIYCTTSNGVVIEISDGMLKTHNLDIWYQEQIISCNGNILIRSQNGIHCIEKGSFDKKSERFFRKVTNYMEIFEDSLYVLAECSVYKIGLDSLNQQ